MKVTSAFDCKVPSGPGFLQTDPQEHPASIRHRYQALRYSCPYCSGMDNTSLFSENQTLCLTKGKKRAPIYVYK